MKKNKPLVSVVMPVFNGDRFINKAIESILNQTLKDFEFIIINDASTDKSLQIINKYKSKDKRIKLINNRKNIHMSQSINLGISKAKSDLIARMDQDDIAFPERLKVQYAFLKSHPKVAIVGNNILTVNEFDSITGKRTYPTTSKDLKKIMFRYSPFAHPTVMFRKKIFQDLGGLDLRMVPCEDTDFWFKLGVNQEFASIPSYLLKYRITITSMSHHNVKKTEIMGFKIKINAIRKYGYKPSLYDIIYNILQFATAWFMPPEARVRLYNFLRSRDLI